MAETHISTVFFAGERAYKLLKPVQTAFLDHRTREARARACHREVELNRRFAPDVYLGVSDLLENGEPADHLIVMRRLPADRRLSNLLGGPDGADQVRAVARAVAVVHAGLEPLAEGARYAGADVIVARWITELDQMESFAGRYVDLVDIDRARDLAKAYLAGRGPLFQQRIDDGLVRDGHGDLLADDIFCLSDGPRILDCLAFDDDLRRGDVLADVAFLAMDLERLAGPPMSAAFMGAYQEFSAEHHPSSLAHHYVAARALVRSKVAALKADQGQVEERVEAWRMMQLCLRHLERAAVRVVMVGGLPGTGKSTIASAIADAMNWSLLSSDELRKDLAGVAHEEPAVAAPGEGIYDETWTQRTYAELMRRVARLVERGESVVVDASWSDAAQRERLREVAATGGASMIELRCSASIEVAAARVLRRTSGPSDATPEVLDHLAAGFDPWPESSSLDTERSLDETVPAGLRVVARPIG